jgi:hypothetical protein
MPRGDKSSYTRKQKRKGIRERSRTARLGDGQLGRWRRREEGRVRPRQEAKEDGLAQGRPRVRQPVESSTITLGQEGGAHPQAARSLARRTATQVNARPSRGGRNRRPAPCRRSL